MSSLQRPTLPLVANTREYTNTTKLIAYYIKWKVLEILFQMSCLFYFEKFDLLALKNNYDKKIFNFGTTEAKID